MHQFGNDILLPHRPDDTSSVLQTANTLGPRHQSSQRKLSVNSFHSCGALEVQRVSAPLCVLHSNSKMRLPWKNILQGSPLAKLRRTRTSPYTRLTRDHSLPSQPLTAYLTDITRCPIRSYADALQPYPLPKMVTEGAWSNFQLQRVGQARKDCETTPCLEKFPL